MHFRRSVFAPTLVLLFSTFVVALPPLAPFEKGGLKVGQPFSRLIAFRVFAAVN